MKKIILLTLFSVFVYAKNLVVLDSASIEIIYMLNAQNHIKGIAKLQQSSIHPKEETEKLPSVGSFSNPSLEKIISLKPDLVILSQYSIGLKEKLENLGIETLYLESKRLDDIYSNITTLGKILDKNKEAEELKKDFKAKLDELSKEPIKRSAIFLFSSSPLMAFSNNSLIADILKIIGVKNLSPDSDIKRPIITSEYILKANPEILLLGIEANNIENLLSYNPILKNITATKNNNILIYKNTLPLMRLSPNIIDSIKDLKSFIKSNVK
ncbi:ABC transporter substrate-binding protein [Helicobacter sp. MIT 14-3879]|uniref:ABC transporter substrate-binding protein n=1 Tax=Helicobacter sp. MIT 14-3879 TaxID=2040649 RepID=UPI000E1F57F0|nr:ABC transporter substrate-binding protein [Helicobacter sp. MIT 14-3879]RDU65124.1 ABC transporter substrate-binding protein [Helicobacter sp. MIT 14-3879]